MWCCCRGSWRSLPRFASNSWWVALRIVVESILGGSCYTGCNRNVIFVIIGLEDLSLIFWLIHCWIFMKLLFIVELISSILNSGNLNRLGLIDWIFMKLLLIVKLCRSIVLDSCNLDRLWLIGWIFVELLFIGTYRNRLWAYLLIFYRLWSSKLNILDLVKSNIHLGFWSVYYDCLLWNYEWGLRSYMTLYFWRILHLNHSWLHLNNSWLHLNNFWRTLSNCLSLRYSSEGKIYSFGIKFFKIKNLIGMSPQYFLNLKTNNSILIIRITHSSHNISQ